FCKSDVRKGFARLTIQIRRNARSALTECTGQTQFLPAPRVSWDLASGGRLEKIDQLVEISIQRGVSHAQLLFAARVVQGRHPGIAERRTVRQESVTLQLGSR